MEQSEINLLNEIKQVSIDNNKKLDIIIKQNKIALWTKALYWVVIILLTIGAFKVVGPMLGSLKSIYMPSGGSGGALNLLSSPDMVNELKYQLGGE